MRSYEQVQAAVSVIVPKGGIRGNNGSQSNGLSRGESIASRSACAIVRCRAMLCASVRKNGCRLGGLRFSRRITATLHDSMCGVSFCGFRNHGLIAPVPFYGLMPCGKPSGLSLPRERSANPRGVSHLLGGWWGISYSLTRGIKAMMRTLSRNVSTAFPSTPEPTFLPVQSRRKHVEERPRSTPLPMWPTAPRACYSALRPHTVRLPPCRPLLLVPSFAPVSPTIWPS